MLKRSCAALSLFVGCATTVAQPAPVSAPLPDLRFDIGALDRKVDPCVDFYEFACGGWRATHPIPGDRGKWTRYSELEALNQERVKTIVEEAMRGGPGQPVSVARVGDLYAACLDEAGIEARGLSPLAELFGAIDTMKTPEEVARLMARLHTDAADFLFEVYMDPDPADGRQVTTWIDQGSLGLGGPDDYVRDDPKSAELRQRYEVLVKNVLTLSGDADAAANASRVLAFETAFAQSLPPPAERRISEKRVNPITAEALITRAPAFAWTTYFEAIGVKGLKSLNLAYPTWVDATNAALKGGELVSLKAYLRFHLMRVFSPVLPRATDQAFVIFKQGASGAKEQPPRWKRCLGIIDRNLGEEVGRIFVERYFPPSSKARAKALVDSMVVAFKEDLASNDWLSAAARDAAGKKLSNMHFTIGGPDVLKGYDSLVIKRDDPVGNARRARAQRRLREWGKLRKPTERDGFFAWPQQLDGFGTKSLVSVGFTAGFLQPPVFDARLDDAINFGGFGGVIGHEILHHFDDEGRKFDEQKKLRAWWSPQDIERYESKTQCFVDEYSKFKADDGTLLNGKLTLGENLADNAGLRLAWQAAHPSSSPLIDGFTPAQRFFLGWGQIRCENVTAETARRLAQSDEHSPGRWRVNGVVSNLSEFAEAFQCKAGAPMAPLNRCRVW